MSLLRKAHRLEVGLGPGVVEPLAEGGAVLERDPEIRVGDEEAQAAAAEVELAHHQLVEQADDVGAGADDVTVVGEGALEGAGAAEPLAALENEDAAPGPRQVGGRGEAVVAAADDDHVPLAGGEVAERLRQPDLPELGGDLVHCPRASLAANQQPPRAQTPRASM